MPVREIENYLVLMLSMKAPGKKVDFNHLREKSRRDLKAKESDLKKAVDELLKRGLLQEKRGLYSASDKGRSWFAAQMPKLEQELRKINEPWVIVYKAKQYYPHVADTIFQFCKDRHTGFYCLFTEKRFFRRDFKGKKIVLKKPSDLLFFANMHYIDVIPCVHRIGQKRPDWLVVDIDAGPKVSWKKTKEVTTIIYKIFEKLKLNPALKFSGSRGFQIWSLIKDFKLPVGYKPFVLRGETKRERNYFSFFADAIRAIQQEVDKELPGLTTSEVALKAGREKMILLDPSSMKPEGLVRAPYGVHSKTGLVSLPLAAEELKKFNPEDATTEKTLARYKKRGNEFVLKAADAKKFIGLLL